MNVVEQAREDGCDTIVYASTSSAYGSRTEPNPEDMTLEAATRYDASMLGRERYGEYYNDFYDDLSCAGMRFFSVYQGYGGNEATEASTRTPSRSSRTRLRTMSRPCCGRTAARRGTSRTTTTSCAG